MPDTTNDDFIKKFQEIKASSIMSKHAITVTENDSVSDLAHLMMRFKLSGVPVVSKGKDICGIVTATDLFNQMKKITNSIDHSEDLKIYFDIPVTTIMTRKVHTVEEGTSLYEIMKIMCHKDIHTLPVVRGRKIIGIIGRRDVMNACFVGSDNNSKMNG